MKVVNTIPFLLVYSILEHPYFGYVIEPHVVQINSLGHLTLSHQKLFSANFEYYTKGIDDTDKKLVKILEELDQERIVKRFYKKGKIRPAEYFKKHFDEETFKKLIRPFIEKKLAEAIPLMREKPIYLMSKDGNPAAKEIKMAPESASVLFHFRRDERGTNYFPTIRCQNENVEFKGHHGVILVNQPAWLVNDGVLYTFEKNVDGNKFRPFLNKKYIHIPQTTEQTYFQKFVVPLVEKFDVYAKGFEIKSETHNANPVISIDNNWGDGIRLNLGFEYDSHRFPYHSGKKVSVFLEKNGTDYIFHRIRRNKDWEEKQKQLLEEDGLKLFQGSSFKTADGVHGLDWLNEKSEDLKKRGYRIHQGDDKKYFIGNRSVELKAREDGDWFDVQALVHFGEFEIPFSRLRRYLQEGKREFPLPNGEIAIIPESWFVQFSELIEMSHDPHGLRLHRHHYQLLENLQLSQASEDLHARLAAIDDWKREVPAAPSELFNGNLRPYQLEGFHWFYFLKNNRFGGCLADDMGLGKTIQALALLASEAAWNVRLEKEVHVMSEMTLNSGGDNQISLFDSNQEGDERKSEKKQIVRAVSLVVAPTSLVYNWMREANTFVPGLRVYIHTGTNRYKTLEVFKNYDLVLTTYGVLRLDIDWMEEMDFHYVILDESQAIKNPSALTSRTVRRLKAANRLVLTGTPIENSVTDLWSQMNFINPGLLGTYSYFQKKFVIPIEKDGNEVAKQRLHELITPFVLRRTKRQVAADLPDKYELIHYCEMTEEQEKLYDETKSIFRNQILQVVSAQGMMKSKLQILKGLVLLRQISNHPLLANPEYLGESGKFTEITRMLETAMQEGHKILLFSQFVKHLQLFRNYFDQRNIEYAYLDGTTPAKQRMKEVKRFNEDESLSIFLISLKAGGTGLNLTSADYVFLADPWWNPAVEQQAIDRAHRIGQTQKVFSYKFITKNSVEEKIVSLQKKKLALSENLIESDDFILRDMDLVELEELLK
ncbi:MAG: ATP-dependent helicase [Bacteroidetes bacterium]|nr:ATP-dependent helicase [Bacteroidota bacterium]